MNTTWKLARRGLMQTALMLCVASVAVGSARAAIFGPYATDAQTLHLYHFDDASSPATDSVGGVNLNAGSGATLNNPAFSGFGTAGDTSANANAVFLSVNEHAPPVGAGGAFTYEAMINVSNSGGLQQIFSMDTNDNPLPNRPFQFRLASGALQFLNIGGASGIDGNSNATIPTAGADAFVANQWFHVAVAYDGNENTTNNLKLYWTRADDSRTAANLIGSFTLVDDLTASTARYGVGNDGRTVGDQNKNLEGLIDEVRISGVARNGSEFLFSRAADQNFTLFADNFNAPNGPVTSNTNFPGRQSGLAAPANYTLVGAGTSPIDDNQVQITSVSASRAMVPNVDFASGTLGAAITGAGAFVLDVDVTPVVGGNGTSANWAAVSFGHTTTSVSGGQPYLVSPSADFGILLRGNGQFQIFDGGVNVSPTDLVFDTTPSGDESYHLQLVVETTGFSLGTPATLYAFINGLGLDLTNGPGLGYGFNWDSEGTNYLALETRTNVARFDNLRVSVPTPEPSTWVLLVGMAGGLAWRVRRRR